MQDEDLTHGTVEQKPNFHVESCSDKTYKSRLSLGTKAKTASASLNKLSPTVIHLPKVELPTIANVELLPKVDEQLCDVR